MSNPIKALEEAVKQLNALIEDQFATCGQVSAVIWEARYEAQQHLTSLRRQVLEQAAQA